MLRELGNIVYSPGLKGLAFTGCSVLLTMATDCEAPGVLISMKELLRKAILQRHHKNQSAGAHDAAAAKARTAAYAQVLFLLLQQQS